MLFNTIDFFIFLPIVFILYWFVFNKHLRTQNMLILIASYFFYGWWDWRFLFLIFLSTVMDYLVGLKIFKSTTQVLRRRWLWLSVGFNVGLLGFFKYFNFFIDSWVDMLNALGMQTESTWTLQVILPVGISFYTFQTMSYSFDIYYKKLEPTNDFIGFAAFVGFFPQLVAGPIERASNLLPQFCSKRTFNLAKAKDGLRQMLWGLFKKVVIADNCASYANMIFDNSDNYSSSTLIMGAFFFAFQIYGDFSGYSDIAIGVSRVFGFDLKRNFAFPYFSRDIAEFWRRWHISLSTWFRDYLYIPMGGSRGDIKIKVRNIIIIFLVSGFWHGANWTFIIWGALNAIYFLPLLLLNKNRINTNLVAENKWLPSLKEFFQMLSTFMITLFAWIFFRADSVVHAFDYLSGIFSTGLFTIPEILPLYLLYLVMGFMVIEWLGRHGEHAIEQLVAYGKGWRWLFYFGVIFILFAFAGEEQEFIYFQF